MALPLLELSPKDIKTFWRQGGRYWVPVNDLFASSVPTLSSQCPIQCGCRDCYDSIYPYPFIPSTQGRLFGCPACQVDYLSGWRHGAESEIFQVLIEKDPLSAVRQKGADKKFPGSRSTIHFWLLPLLLLFSNQCDFPGTFLEVHSLIEFYKRK